MSDVLIPKKTESTDTALDRSRFGFGYDLRIPLDTSLSEGGGLGHSFRLSYEYAESFQERFPLLLEFGLDRTEGKLFPSTFAEGTTTENSSWWAMIGLGRTTRSLPYFTDAGNYVAGLNVTTTPMLGFGKKTRGQPDRVLEGETFSFPGEEKMLLHWGQRVDASGEFRFSDNRFPTINIGPSFYYGVRYSGEGNELNGLDLTFMLSLSLAYGDAPTENGGAIDSEVGAMAIAQYLFGMGHGWGQRALMDKVLTAPTDALTDYGLLTNEPGADRGSMANVPAFQLGATFLGASGNQLNVPLRAGTGWYYGLLAARAAGGAGFLFAGGKAGQGGGLSDLLGCVRLAGYIGMESPEKRSSRSDEAIARRTMWIDLASFGLGALVMGVGGAAKNDVAMNGGMGANLALAMTPDPLELTAVESTDFGYAPGAYLTGSTGEGWLSGVVIHKGLRDWPMQHFQLFTEAGAFTPSLRLDNVANHPSQSRPYDDIELPSLATATIGLEGMPSIWTRFKFGLDVMGLYGSDMSAGIGGMAGFDLLVHFNGKEDGVGIALGAEAKAHAVLSSGWQVMVIPTVGLLLPTGAF